jgi:lipase
VGEEPELRSRASLEAVREGARDSLVSEELEQAPARVAQPALFLRAPYGMLGAEPALYPEEPLEEQLRTLPSLRVETIPDVNHYTITMGKAGAAVVADRIREYAKG